jgi:secondary thiamine-phosphate synthase enzyme
MVYLIMRVFNYSFTFGTHKGIEFVDLTERIKSVVGGSSINIGIVCVYGLHTTGAIIINEYDENLLGDIRNLIEEIVPSKKNYEHVNAPSHLISCLFDPSKVIPINDGKLGLGTYQRIIWVEVERLPRTRTVHLTIIGE